MPVPGVHIEVLSSPSEYTQAQIELAASVAAVLNRGKLVIVEAPDTTSR